MKKSLALLGIGTAWILFTGLIGVKLPVLPVKPPSLFTPLPPPTFNPSSVKASRPASFLSHLERKWQTERLLATSA